MKTTSSIVVRSWRAGTTPLTGRLGLTVGIVLVWAP